MTLHGLSQRFLSAVAGDHDWALSVEVYTPGGTLLEDITEFVTAGSVTMDETREIRRQLSLTIQGTKALIPAKAGDLLHPATANEIHVSRGVKYSDGTTELASLGVFRPSKPAINDTEQVSFTMGGNDRASVVARQGWQTAYQVTGGSNMSGVLQAVLTFLVGHIYPEMNFNQFQSPDSFLFPNTTWGTTPAQTSDPMSDLQAFAATAGCELFFDVTGQPVFRQIVNPTVSSVIDSVHFVEGENCTMTQAGRTLDETVAYNGVILYCNGPGTAGPFVVKVWDTNPSSPTYFKGPWGQVPYLMTTTTIPAGLDPAGTAQSKGLLMAQQQLQLILGALDTTNISTVPNPALREGDCVSVARSRINLSGNYVISSMTTPLDPLSPQTIVFRPKVSSS